MAWDKNSGFSGSLITILEELFRHYYPDPVIAADAQAWLIEQLSLKKGPFVFRHSADIRKLNSRPGNSKPRFYFAKDFNEVSFDIIASDNEANASFYSSLLGNTPTSFQNMTILQALQGPIKVGILRKQGCPEIERKAFRNNSIKTTMNDHPLRPSQADLQLDHIFDAAQKFMCPFGSTQLIERCFRLLSPLNVFPFPSSRKFQHNLNKTILPQGIGGSPEGQNAFRDFLFIKFHDHNQIDALKDYYSQLNQPIPKFAEVRARIASLATWQVQITPITIRSQKTTRRLVADAKRHQPTQGTVTFEIVENDKRRTSPLLGLTSQASSLNLSHSGKQASVIPNRAVDQVFCTDPNELKILLEEWLDHNSAVRVDGRTGTKGNPYPQCGFTYNGQVWALAGDTRRAAVEKFVKLMKENDCDPTKVFIEGESRGGRSPKLILNHHDKKGWQCLSGHNRVMTVSNFRRFNNKQAS